MVPWATRTDPLLSWGERVGKALWWVLGGPAVTGAVLGVLAWVVQNPFYGVLIGLAGWALTQVGFTVWAIRNLAAAGAPSAEPEEMQADAAGTDSLQELETYRAENAVLEAQRDKLQAKVLAYDGDRARLKELLTDAYVEGTSLRESEPDREAADEWATAVSRLIRAAFGDHPVEVFEDDSEDRLATDPNATREQAWLDNRLHRLDRLRQTLEVREAVPFRSGFDPHEWKDWKSPPPTGSEESEQLRAKLREVEQGRNSLRSEVQQLRAMSPEEARIRRDQRRKRIEDWRAAVRGFYSGDTYGYFAATDTYSEMRPHLRPEVIEMLETPRMSTVGNEARGDVAYRSALLDEIARIEGEWGLI